MARKLLPRFSLTTLVLLTTVVAMGITIATLWRELAPLRAENRRLRDEVGELSIEDRTKLHAIRVANTGELIWKWRVWLPAGRRYRLRSDGGPLQVSEEGFPEEGGSMYLEPPESPGEEIWVEYRIRQDRDGKWRGSMRTRQGSVGADSHAWVGAGNMSTTAGVGESTVVAKPDERFLLARFRTADVSNSQDMPDPADGFMVWIEPR